MWSGPRNISTAMMRSWENRPDTTVWDEPFYAHYLLRTDVRHPGRAEVIAAHETDADAVVRRILGPLPDGADVFYQKHMAHHMLPGMDLEWMDDVANAFLIRDPADVLRSLARNVPDPRLEQTGLPQQVGLFERVRRRTGRVPPVVDARDVLEDPAGTLRRLCEAMGVPFTPRMLSWPPGPRDSDGIWAKHWYRSVLRSTGFKPYQAKTTPVPNRHRDVLAECLPLYQHLRRYRLRGPTHATNVP